MKLKDGREVTELTTIASARKAIREGKTVVVMAKCGWQYYRQVDVTTLEELNSTANAYKGMQIGNIAHKAKPAYFIVND